MTVRARITAALPEARRMSNFLDRDFSADGAVVSLDERPHDLWAVEAYFETDDAAEVERRIRDRLGSDAFAAPLSVERLAQTDWIALSLEGLKPVVAGRFVVHGAHDRGSLPAGLVPIEIEAGQAFGTGHHGTTAGCLRVLDRLLRTRRFTNPLDLGTGSGVLAIALARILHRAVLATDIDPIAIRVAAANAKLNGVGGKVKAVVADGFGHASIRRRAPFDLIVANILAEPLMRLAPAMSRAVQPDGILVLSGLLPEQGERVAAAYRQHGLRLVRAEPSDGWLVLTLRKPGGRL